MSVRNSLLAILAEQPAHGYALKSQFEERTAGMWPLNVGQVYTTLGRLERDGLVRAEDADERSRQAWKITRSGRTALARWYDTPVGETQPRDELAIKVLLAVAAGAVDLTNIIQAQRSATMTRLQAYTRHLRDADPESELTWVLLLDSLILKAEAEIKWLDRCEERMRLRS